jgi:hypothetical protein
VTPRTSAACRTVALMTAQPSEVPGQPQTIRIAGEVAAVIPIGEYQRLKAIERHASPEEVAAAEAEEAEIAGVFAEYRQWVAGGEQGGMWQEEFEQSLGIGPAR